jgi:hypothetical protein
LKYLLIIAVVFIVGRFFRLGILSFNVDAAKRELDKTRKKQKENHTDDYIPYEEIE